jgi:hypothetical protein
LVLRIPLLPMEAVFLFYALSIKFADSAMSNEDIGK